MFLALAGSCSGSGEPFAFTSGVAAGEVTSDTAVLWTRTNHAGMLDVEVATDGKFTRTAHEQELEVSGESDYTATITISALKPATAYYYRFRHDGVVSDTGMFRTAPLENVASPVRFVFSGDTDGSVGADGKRAYDLQILDAAAQEDPAFFVYLGDTIVADSPLGTPAVTRDMYRAKYRENRGIDAMKGLLASTSTYAIWNDNEVQRNFSGKTVDPQLLLAASQAFREYLPVGGDMSSPLYRRVRWGRAVELFVLDVRSNRDSGAASACTASGTTTPDVLPALGAPGVPASYRGLRTTAGLAPETDAACLDALAQDRTMLGGEQLRWLKDSLADSDALFKFIVTPVPMSELIVQPYDRWEGYRSERYDLLTYIRDKKIKNVVFLSSDIQANVISDVRLDLASPGIATEVIAGPVGAETLGASIERAQGKAAVAVFEQLFLEVARVKCARFNAYSYGVVAIDPVARTASVVLKDENGGVLCRTVVKAQ